MRRPFYFLALVFILSFPHLIFAEGFYFSGEFFLRESNGNQGEYVYVTDSSGNKRLLSELIWDATPVFDFGLSFAGGWKNLGLEISAGSALPLPCGKMTDSDWMNNQDFPDCDESLSSIKSHYTESICKTDYSFTICADFFYAFRPSPYFAIKPSCGIEYDASSFTAYGLDGAYFLRFSSYDYWGWWNDGSSNNKKDTDKNTKVIRLKRDTLKIWTGFSLEIAPAAKWTIEGSFALSPYVYMASLDEHLLKNENYYDLMSGFFSSFKCGLSGKYAAGERFEVGLGADFSYMSKIYGKSYSLGSDGSAYRLNDVPAADSISLSFRLGARYHFVKKD